MCSLYKIFNKNIKLSYISMSYVANLINKSNTKNLWMNYVRSLLKSNALIKLIAPLRGKYQYKSVIYKVEIYCDHNVVKNYNKKLYIGSKKDVFLKKEFIIINVVSSMRHIKNSTNS